MSLLMLLEIIVLFFAVVGSVSEVLIPLARGQKFFPTIRYLFGESTIAERELRVVQDQAEEVRTIEEAERLNRENLERLTKPH